MPKSQARRRSALLAVAKFMRMQFEIINDCVLWRTTCFQASRQLTPLARPLSRRLPYEAGRGPSRSRQVTSRAVPADPAVTALEPPLRYEPGAPGA